ncbi:MAG: CPBP family intramembrane metalloprotease [Deltaproteobacteria bacterium]|nr:CPBP family intramembrane metalloprotease [Deltaproteobacteria bacterium]
MINRDLLLPYGAPYFAYVGIASLSQGKIPVEINYMLKIIIVPVLLCWAWKWYTPVTGPKKISGSIFYGIVFGIAGLAIWCLFLAPFIEVKGESWARSGFFLRLFSASIIVPVFEEFFIRGYIFRAAFQWSVNMKSKKIISSLNETLDNNSINDVSPGAWSIMAIAVSTVAFAAGHLPVEWPAAVAYSILISILWIIRKDLLSCMVAHGITNLTLALYVYFTGQWGFW